MEGGKGERLGGSGLRGSSSFNPPLYRVPQHTLDITTLTISKLLKETFLRNALKNEWNFRYDFCMKFNFPQKIFLKIMLGLTVFHLSPFKVSNMRF